MNLQAPTVFVVDDDTSVHRAVSRLLRSAGYDVEAFSGAAEFLDSKRHQQSPACLILDLQLPDLSGMELQVRLRNLLSALGFVFISGQGDIPTSVEAMKGGAVDFLQKPFDAETLLSAVATALDRSVREDKTHREIKEIRERLVTLTPREREVMDLVVHGWRNKQVADELGTVEKTIKVHRGRIMEKMGAGSLAELVRMAERVSRETAA